MPSPACSISEATISGLRAAVLENKVLRAVVLLDRGADVLELWHKPSEIQVFWRSPLGVRSHGLFMPAEYGDRATFFDYYAGGLQEVFPNGGPSYRYRGAELGFHGEACKVPWTGEITAADDEVALDCTTRIARMPFHLRKRFILRSDTSVLEIEASLTNESGQLLDCMWGFHPAYSEPFLGPKTRLYTGAREVEVHPEPIGSRYVFEPGSTFPWPGPSGNPRHPRVDDLLPAEGPSADLCYLKGMTDGWYVLINEERGLGVAMGWDTRVFPYLWFWQECHDDAGYPWYGRHHIVGVEPWTSYPSSGLGEAIRRGTQLQVSPHATIATKLVIAVFARDRSAGDPIGVDERGLVRYER